MHGLWPEIKLYYYYIMICVNNNNNTDIPGRPYMDFIVHIEF